MMSNLKTKSNFTLQVLSFSCVIHCLSLPYLLLVLPFIGHILIEITLIVVSVVTGVYIIYRGYSRHQNIRSVFTYAFGVIVLSFHYIFEYLKLSNSEVFLYVGPIIIAISYYINHFYLKKFSIDCSHDH